MKSVNSTSNSVVEMTQTPPTLENDSEDSEVYLLLITIQLGLILIYKLIKLVAKGYNIHNKNIIKKHESISPRAT